ncbi:TauD/TfdA dioxygenase family protein [Mycobacterium sp. Marseille-P9652]|uniref:TauD/TfdA dioxygenase family protein n=1 Tax=Mycobacterium sp. Marseille-P9652 TaxID=2654950 RepID=UPI0012E92AF9|nr:TauD/TfdA family dioxygenase [Mycobacterium sp. Marseille-P9652]
MTTTVHRATEAPAGLELVHLSPTIGTEVLGIDLREQLDDSTITWLRSLLLDRKVIFFRDQDITVEQHMDFGRRFGELEIVPFLPQHPQYPEVLTIRRSADNKATENIWHSDVSWREEPSLGSILRARVVPETGGDTLFADMCLAYDRLSEGWKRHVEGLTAEHSIAHSLGVYIDDDTMRAMLKQFPPQTHPVIRTHPETGRKLIYVNDAHTSRVVGVKREDSRWVLQHLYQQAWYPEVQCRFHWRPNSIAFWDNRACQHYAAQDYYPAQRDMDRVTVVGDRPF